MRLYSTYIVKVGSVLLLACLLSNRVADAQQVFSEEPIRWFTNQVLAPRSDWHRSDLAAKNVRQITRTFRAQVLGNSHQAVRPGQKVQEVLRYDAQGYLLRYDYILLGRATKRVINWFSYDSLRRLHRIQVTGDSSLLAVRDVFSSKAYARWRGTSPRFREQHHLPAQHELRELFPDTWQLNGIICHYDAAGRPLLPQAVVAFTSYAPANSATLSHNIIWTDTVLLDPRRNWLLATPDTLAGYADTAWIHQPDFWWQPRVNTIPVPGLRLQHLPPNAPEYGQRHGSDDYDYGEYPTVEAKYGFTGFFGSNGQLQLARIAGAGTVLRYTYDALNQLQRVESFFMHLPRRHGESSYFGSVSNLLPITDCEKRQRQALQLPSGKQAVREWQWTWNVQYERYVQGLPRRAVVRTTVPRYAVAVSFNETLDTVQPTGPHGTLVAVKHWRKVKALLQRQQEFLDRGCVPMTLITKDAQVVNFRYKYFR